MFAVRLCNHAEVIDWNDYRVFLALSRERSLSAAARRLDVDQTTVGRRLQTLEAAARARLFERTPSGYHLTAAGEAVLADVEALEAGVDRVERKLIGHDAEPRGNVRLATSDSFAVWFLVPRLAPLHERYPALTLELVTGTPAVDLARREADVSLRLSKPTQPGLVARCIGKAAWGLYASKRYLERFGLPKPNSQLQGHDVVALDDELKTTLGARWLRANGSQGRVVLRANSLLTQASAVASGLGISPLPCIFGDREPELQRVLRDPIGEHEIWLVVHPDVKSSARVRVVMDFLDEVIAKEAAFLTGTRAHPRRRR